MALGDAEKITILPARKGFDVLGSPQGRGELSAACDGDWRCGSNDPTLDSASEGQPQSAAARIASSGLLGAKMRAWDSDSRAGPPVGMPLVRRNGDAGPSRFSGWDRSGGGEADQTSEANIEARQSEYSTRFDAASSTPENWCEEGQGAIFWGLTAAILFFGSLATAAILHVGGWLQGVE